MAGLCEGGNEPPGSLKAKLRFVIGTHCCEGMILISVQSAASASATELKDSQPYAAKMPWSTGADVSRRFVYYCKRYLQWFGILGRSLLLGIPVATAQVYLAEDFDLGYLTTEDVCCSSRRNVWEHLHQ
ncbi:hypothetical protein ANN_21517 [Periplaneta americana]|uniref:Uncharacterized protein n=1 Tax=Periplaneta americana TaxID=6978 RepID=A0ABQ8SG06_PERAM|nr:hypothetical protein ANN_21517 [Periplaneta americana]